MRAWDWIAVLIAIFAAAGAALTASVVFEDLAHLEDEFAYLWQAEVFSRGDLTIESPEYSSSFLVPFVIDFQGQRFGKYPPGWPAVLSLGFRLGLKNWVNPFLAGLGVWLVYRLGSSVFNARAGLLAAGLTASSPLYIIQGGTYLSHTWSLVLSVIFMLSWVEGLLRAPVDFRGKSALTAAAGGLSLGLLGLTRPLTMVGVSAPFFVHGLILLWKGNPRQRRWLIFVGISAVMIAACYLIWQAALTGDPFTNPYTLWWDYDRLGFGEGFGVAPGGHSLQQAWWNTKHSLRTGSSDLFGWGKLSWILLPFGIWLGRKRKETYLLLGVFVSLVGLYLAYWVGSWLLGPRYYFEALPGLAVISAGGMFWLAGWETGEHDREPVPSNWQRFRSLAAAAGLALLLFANFRFYLPTRLSSLQGLYTISRSDQEPFRKLDQQGLTPALVIVHSQDWMSYASLLQMGSPYLDSPLIFAWNIGPKTDRALADSYHEQRQVYHYYPHQQRWKLYTSPQ